MSLQIEAQNQLGELLMVGFSGTQLSEDTARFLTQSQIGGVILFQQNYESPEQLAELNKSIQQCRPSLPFWISVDQEGGRVQRFKDPFTLLPPAMEICQITSPRAAFEIAQICAKELASTGVNVNFAPVADILTRKNNPAIGDRAFGDEPDLVSRMVTATVRGLITNGVQPCVKHFPGHGDTTVDSHFDLPQVNTTREVLEQREFRPFMKAFKSRCSMVMIAHIVLESIDSEHPASLSSKIILDILRKEFRYSKLILSDDMEMQAITDRYSAEEAPVRAIEAGCDLLIYRSEEKGREAYDALSRALGTGRLSPERVLESANRCRQLKETALPQGELPDPKKAKQIVGCEEHQKLIQELFASRHPTND